MENLFLTVLGMSATGSLVILAVLPARLALRKAPKIFSYALWAVALFRLLCPVTIESAFSLLPSARMVSVAGRGESTDQVIRVQTGLPALNSQVNDFLADHPYQEGQPALPGSPEENPAPALNQLGPAPDWRALPAAVWLAGCAALLGYDLVSLLRLRRKLTGSVPLEGEKNVRLADHIPSPFVLGLFRPTIYLPSGLAEGERDYILLHERTHIRRLDHVTRALAWLAAAVHWFNPLVWLAFYLAGKDMEMSCDEAVLAKLGRSVRADYSSSLLRLSVGGRLPVGPLAFGGSGFQSRIKNILSYQKPARWVLAAALVGVLCAGAALATDRAPGLFIDPDSIVSYTMVNSTSSRTQSAERGTVSTEADRQKDLADPARRTPLSKEKGDELARLVNEHRKSVYGRGELTLSGSEHNLVRMDRRDGGYYLLDYWYWNGFSFHPLHPGEDSYTTLVTEYGADGKAGTTWQMEYDFDRAYKNWRPDGGPGGEGTFSPGPASAWVDYSSAPRDMPWDESRETQLPEYPGVTFRWTAGAATAAEGDRETTLFQGMPVWSVFLCDLSGDGKRELCAQVSFGSGLIDERVLVYDYARQTLYELENRFEGKDYTLRLEGDRLTAAEKERGAEILREGQLVLVPYYDGKTEPELGLLSGGNVWGRNGPICVVDFAAPDDSGTDLTYELGQTDTGPFVRMNGAVLGHTLERNAVWWHSGMEELYDGHSGGLSMRYTFEQGGAELMAWWADEEHKTVALSSKTSAMVSSYMPCGWWEFTVDLSGEQGRVTAMEAEGGESTLPDPVKMYPESITNQEAVFAARIAAKLLTAAEDFYNNYDGPIPSPPTETVKYTPVYSPGSGNGSGDVHIGGLGDGYIEWSFNTSPNKGSVYFAADLSFFCPRLAGKRAEGSFMWGGEDRSTVSLVMNVNDERVVSGTVSGFYVHFVADLEDNAVVKRDFESMVEGETLELTDEEMVYAAQVFAGLLTGAEAYWLDHQPAPSPAPSPSPAPTPKPTAAPAPAATPGPDTSWLETGIMTGPLDPAPAPPPGALDGFLWYPWGFFRGNSMSWKIAPAPSNGSHIRCTYANEVGLPVVLLLCRKDTDTGIVPDIVSQLTVPAGETRSMVYDIPADGFREYYLVMEEPREGRSIQGYIAITQF